MKTTYLMALLIASSLTFQACNENKKDGSDSVENANDANDLKEQQSKAAEDDDSDFAVKAANGGILELEAAKLAHQKAQSGEVKAFAAMMVADHQKANETLTALAGRKNITLPVRLGDDDQKHIDELVVEDHQDDVKLFKEAADAAHDADLKAYAAGQLPTLQKHLERITTIEKNLD